MLLLDGSTFVPEGVKTTAPTPAPIATPRTPRPMETVNAAPTARLTAAAAAAAVVVAVIAL